MAEPSLMYATVDEAAGLVEIHGADGIGPRLRASRFRRDDSRGVWVSSFRHEQEFLAQMAWVISQGIPLHENVELESKHLEILVPLKTISFVEEGGVQRAVVEDIE